MDLIEKKVDVSKKISPQKIKDKKAKPINPLSINISKDDFIPMLSQIQGLLEKRSHLQILSNLMIEAEDGIIKIFASDSELSFSGRFNGSIEKEGKAVVDGKKLFEIVKEMPSGDFRLSVEKNNQIKISKGKAIFKIHGLNPDDFPVFPPIKKDLQTQKIPVEDILEVIDKTLYCVSVDESRYHLTGVYCEPSNDKYRFVATDGHRMSFVDIPFSKNIKNSFKESFIIPKKALQEIKKMLAFSGEKDILEIALDKPRLIVKFKNQILAIRLIEGNYPNYKLLIPKKVEQEIILNKNIFLNALKRISVLTSARYKGITFVFKENTLVMAISHPELGEATETIDCEYNHKQELKIRFNSKYVLDVLQSLSEDKIKIILKDSTSSGMIQGFGNENYSSIIMPIKF